MADFPIKKAAAYTYDFPVRDADGKHVTGASITSTISKDGAAFGATTNAAAEIGTTGVYSIALTGTEMTCDRFAVKHVVTSQPDVNVFGETVTRQLIDLAFPTVSGRSIDVDASGGVEVGTVAAGAITAASHGAGAIDAAALATDAVNEIADGLLDRNMATGTDSGSPTVRTVRQALRMLRNKGSIAVGTLTVTKEDDTTASWTAAVTTTAGDPISSVDPA